MIEKIVLLLFCFLLIPRVKSAVNLLNECTSGKHDCHPTRAECNDLPSGYLCLCLAGYKGNGTHCADIDECTSVADKHDCHSSATCKNIDGSFICTCNSGYTGNGKNCADVDECASNTTSHNCDTNANCTNSQGSFSCACKDGFTGNGLHCVDIDECTSNQSKHDCHAQADCTNIQGSFQCTCKTGYRGDGKSCTNSGVDECALGIDICHKTRAECVDLPSGYMCLCLAGYKGNGKTCEDIDECTSSVDKHDCHPQADCSNTNGSFTCSCKNGYNGDGRNCSNLGTNECALGIDICHKTRAECIDLPSGHLCLCLAGYKGNGNTCEDIDECTSAVDKHDCHPQADCSNSNGSFTCTCKNGYVGDGKTCSKPGDNECSLGIDNCHKTRAECVDLPSGYMCLCLAGYKGNGRTCEDINECTSAVDKHDCHLNADCTNFPGSFNCSCKIGFEGDGKSCTALCEPATVSSYKFGKTRPGERAFSTELCSSGRPKASVACSTNATAHAWFNTSSLTALACGVTIRSVVTKAIGGSKEIENQTSTLLLATTGVKLSTKETEEVTGFLETLSDEVNQKNTNISTTILSNVVRVINNLPSSHPTEGSSMPQTTAKDLSLVGTIQSLGSNLKLDDGKKSVKVETEGVTVLVSKPEQGANMGFNDSFYRLNSSRRDATRSSTEHANVFIPAQAFEQANAQTQGQFQSVVSLYKLSERKWVVTANLGKTVRIQNLSRPVQITFTDTPIPGSAEQIEGKLEMRKTDLLCQYFDPLTNQFSSKGLCLVNGTNVCQSTHLTSFGILVKHRTYPIDVSLSTVSIIGCGLSLAGVAATMVLHLSVRSVRSALQTKVFLHLCLGLLIFYSVFLLGVWQTQHDKLCTLIAVFLHYVLLVSWCWMAAYSYTVYASMINLMGLASNHLTKMSLFAYGTPLVVVAATVGLSSVAAGGSDDRTEDASVCGIQHNTKADDMMLGNYRAPNKCWLQGPYQLFGFIVPVGLLLLFNVIIFFLLMKRLLLRKCRQKKRGKKISKDDCKRELMIAVTMATVMGFSWIFGYLTLVTTDLVFNMVMSVLFAISSSLQGLMIFFLTGTRRAELRTIWFDPLQASMVRSASRLSGYIRARVGKRANYTVRQSTSTERIVGTSSFEGTSADISTTTTGEVSVSFDAPNQLVKMKGRSEEFGTIKVISNKSNFDYSVRK